MRQKLQNSIADIIQNTPMLRDYAGHLQRLQKLNRAVQHLLDPAHQPHCQVANLRQGILILSTTAPVWKHQLRFLSVDILTKLRQDRQWAGISSIDIVVIPPLMPSEPPQKANSMEMNAENAQLLHALSETTENPKLKAALEKLAARGKSCPSS